MDRLAVGGEEVAGYVPEIESRDAVWLAASFGRLLFIVVTHASIVSRR